ncbi:MAG: calcium-binding protein [Pirellulales bacterium]
MFKKFQALLSRSNRKGQIGRPNGPGARREQRTLRLESLEDRKMFAINAFLGSDATLTVTGSDSADKIAVVNHGINTVVYDNGTAVFSTPTLGVGRIQVDARGGNDTVQVSNIPFYHPDPILGTLYNKVLPATIDGGAGNDVLIGSQANDILRDSSGNNILRGGDGNDTIYGGSGIDTIDGGNGDDKLYGMGGRNVIQGGAGADAVYGGSDAESIDGGSGNDTLYGSGGDDTMYGGDGNDVVYGDSGNDLLWGGAGNDRLLGNEGNDRLFGDSGADVLLGGSGNDGLFGGEGHDSLSGGTGADRILVWDAALSDIAYHTVNDRESSDAVIHFVDTYGVKTVGKETWEGDFWTETEIEQVDDSLAWYHRLTNNTTLLKTNTGTDMVFERWGANLQESGAGIYAWNLGGGRMSITDVGFNNGKAELDLTVIHEIAHNWDVENPRWTQWLSLSGWRQRSDGSWSSASTATFYGGGAANPMEDWAWSFEAYYLQRQGLLSSADASRLAPKLDLINQFVLSVTT